MSFETLCSVTREPKAEPKDSFFSRETSLEPSCDCHAFLMKFLSSSSSTPFVVIRASSFFDGEEDPGDACVSAVFSTVTGFGGFTATRDGSYE